MKAKWNQRQGWVLQWLPTETIGLQCIFVDTDGYAFYIPASYIRLSTSQLVSWQPWESLPAEDPAPSTTAPA